MESACDMGIKGFNAVMRDAPTLPEEEEYAEGMDQKQDSAVMRDAQTMLRKEDSAGDMGQKSNAVMKGALISP